VTTLRPLTTPALNPCQRCGVFLPAGVSGWCEVCAAREAADATVRRTARLMALCLISGGALLTLPACFAAPHDDLREAGKMLLYGLMCGFGPLVGGLAVAIVRRPGPGWAGAAVMLLCPNNWILAVASVKGLRVVLLGAFCVALGLLLGLRLSRQRAALDISLPR
jgi:hypothetical protein